MKIGVISDTHNYFPATLFSVFQGVDRIIHAGDIADEDVLLELETIAPVIAVYGNSDPYSLAVRLPAERFFTLNGLSFALIHNVGNKKNYLFSVTKKRSGKALHMVIYGHTHQRHHEVLSGIHFLNPGCAGNSRCNTGRSVALVEWKKPDDVKITFKAI